jgi:hypothetical protein
MFRSATIALVVLAGIDAAKFDGVYLHIAAQIATSILRSSGLM